jgi:hypothetical protein
MQEAFFTILVVWILFRVFNSWNPHSSAAKTASKNAGPSASQQPSSFSTKKKISDKVGEYVDFEETKD